MPWITISGVDVDHNILEELTKSINATVLGVAELDLNPDGSEITIFFSPDLAGQPFNKQVVVEVKLLEGQRRTPEVLARLTKAVGTAVKKVLPGVDVDCFPIVVKRETFWSSSS